MDHVYFERLDLVEVRNTKECQTVHIKTPNIVCLGETFIEEIENIHGSASVYVSLQGPKRYMGFNIAP
uniref:Uncharacterized protein n=1 Tax=Rhizophagus irregularis (strain DAOM 181602 / DAOM 197198 / MUCL 43194) TaxID=747089 RepID=U9T4Z2_RHIID